ncbi:DNA methyltransferase [Streptomyces lydicamycinicus]|uniref:DNA methyltransferase n=1 Tax=Streptomyces lydicamycinicus TaxID=1546107 RepID=UPI003C2BBE7A
MNTQPGASLPRPSMLEAGPVPVEWSRVAEHESWRKERHRPATYVHKWWARRLGSVTRNLLLAAASGPGEGPGPARDRLRGLVVYDPFAGSGTTLVEAAKLGAAVVGRDINPVATLTQRQALRPWRPTILEDLFRQVADRCAGPVDELYRTAAGEPVLHYYWVALAPCPECGDEVELFGTRIFARHAYPSRFPTAHALCPFCGEVCKVNLLTQKARGRCSECRRQFPLQGPVAGRSMTCRRKHRTPVVTALAGRPPHRRLYAKQVLCADGIREYRPADAFDRALYDQASQDLAEAGELVVRPLGTLDEGASTVQAIRWGYRSWQQFFNDRQQYALGLIGAALRDLPGAGAEREALIAAFSKTVEHHNLFCSYKGEGTGPVRSVFHNHVLRPERCSVEGNPWGAHGGSAGFVGALDRLRDAATYKDAPLDFVIRGTRVLSESMAAQPISCSLATSWSGFSAASAPATYIATGDAARTDLPDGGVDLIVTDPPYVDNVHYSELADFFHAWLRAMRPYPHYPDTSSTRSSAELQNTSPEGFRATATAVWRECRRVLRPGGCLIFSFHQSSTRGWSALMRSLADAGFAVTATRAVVAEVTTSLSKIAAREPNRIDVIVVCRPSAETTLVKAPPTPERSAREALQELRELRESGIALGPGDARSAVRAAVLATGARAAIPAQRAGVVGGGGGSVDWDALEILADELSDAAAQSFGEAPSPALGPQPKAVAP